MNNRLTRVALRRAKMLIQKGWAKGAYALNAQNNLTDVLGEYATSYCVTGAVWRAVYDLRKMTQPTATDWSLDDPLAIDAFNALRDELAPRYHFPDTAFLRGDLIQFNDEQTTREEVLALYDRAIAALTRRIDDDDRQSSTRPADGSDLRGCAR